MPSSKLASTPSVVVPSAKTNTDATLNIGLPLNNEVNKQRTKQKNQKKGKVKSWAAPAPVISASRSRSAAEHEAGNSFMDEYERFRDDSQNEAGGRTISGGEISTDETASDVLSSMNSTVSSEFGTPYEVIEYGFNGVDSYRADINEMYQDKSMSAGFFSLSPICNPLTPQPSVVVGGVANAAKRDPSTIAAITFPDIDLVIQDDSPAAAALRANANVHVSSVGKAARAAHLQSLRRFAKFAAGANKTGYVKGKPPRVPPKIDGPFGGPSFKHHRRSVSLPHSYPSDEDSADGDNYIAEEGESISEGDLDVDAVSDGEDHENALEGNENLDSGEDDPKYEIGYHYTNDRKGLQHIETDTNTHGIPTDHLSTIDEKTATSGDNVVNVSDLLTNPSHQIKTKTLQSPSRIPSESFHTGSVHVSEGVELGTIEAGKKVLRSVDPHDLLKLQRWRKKQTGKSNRFPKSYVKGKVIDGEHELYTLSIAVMIGVRQSISRTNIELNSGAGKRWVRIQDFRHIEKYEFRPKGDGQTPPHLLAHTFKFKDYSPVVFAYLRRMYGVNEFDFLLSVCGNANFIEFISNAKSGQFFFYSSDGRYMIKTMTNAESKFLRRILPQYFKHCCENPNTMMTRFFGMYRVKLYHLRRNVKFVIMNSVYYTDNNLQSFYDLKGSTVGRDAKPGQAVLKDNDLRKSLPAGALAMKPDQLNAVRNQIASDCDFLQLSEIMDYSMLVGVHFIPYLRNSITGNHIVRAGHAKSQRRVSKSNVKDHHPTVSKHTTNLDSSISSFMAEGSIELTTTAATSHSSLDQHPGHHRRNLSHRNLAFDDGLDDDDSSYLLGSISHPDHCSTMSRSTTNEETERKKLATIEKLFWPFHLWFDIHGYRRLHPLEPPYNSLCADHEEILKGYNIPKFIPPLSDRKDGGFELDTTKLKLPIAIDAAGTTEQFCDGKIFYMGIIDILQEYTTRKSLETTYRQLTNGRSSGVSCIPPKQYADRFVSFFEEYTRCTTGDEKSIKNSE